MYKKWIVFILSLIVVIIISGCSDQPDNDVQIKYKHDALALDGYKTQTRVFPNQQIFIEFWLTNQVEHSVYDVDVKFFNPSVFTIDCIKCGEEECDYNIDTCHFDEIRSLGAERIQAVLKTPDEDVIGEIGGTYRVQFSVEYDYDGQTLYYFPILNVEEESTETGDQLTQTMGPIHFDIDPGFIIEEIIDNQKKRISDWAIQGMAFSVKVTGENVGKLGSGYEYPDIDLYNFDLTLTNVEVGEECDFSDVPGSNVGTYDVTISKEKDFKPLYCILIPKREFTEPEIPGIIKAYYSYRYVFVKTEKIKVETI